jgi:hypothetical protein
VPVEVVREKAPGSKLGDLVLCSRANQRGQRASLVPSRVRASSGLEHTVNFTIARSRRPNNALPPSCSPSEARRRLATVL